jgi:hypothetical protein
VHIPERAPRLIDNMAEATEEASIRQPLGPRQPLDTRLPTRREIECMSELEDARAKLPAPVLRQRIEAPLPSRQQHVVIRSRGNADIDLSPPSFDHTYVQDWGSPGAALEQEWARRRTAPTTARRVVFSDPTSLETNVPMRSHQEQERPGTVIISSHSAATDARVGRPVRTYARPPIVRQETEEDRYVPRTWSGEMRDISEVFFALLSCG